MIHLSFADVAPSNKFFVKLIKCSTWGGELFIQMPTWQLIKLLNCSLTPSSHSFSFLVEEIRIHNKFKSTKGLLSSFDVKQNPTSFSECVGIYRPTCSRYNKGRHGTAIYNRNGFIYHNDALFIFVLVLLWRIWLYKYSCIYCHRRLHHLFMCLLLPRFLFGLRFIVL